MAACVGRGSARSGQVVPNVGNSLRNLSGMERPRTGVASDLLRLANGETGHMARSGANLEPKSAGRLHSPVRACAARPTSRRTGLAARG